MCSDCNGVDGLKYRFGVSCLTECPESTKLNLLTNTCEGCVKGCLLCDIDDPAKCFKCREAYILFEESCYENCPDGTILSFSGDSCRRLTDLDARLVYFPFLIITVLVAFVSWIGHVIKPHHLVFANFAIMLGAVEHLALLVQVLLSFIYGTYGLAIPIIFIWLGYVGTQIAFNYYWRRDVIALDLKFKAYREHADNLRST